MTINSTQLTYCKRFSPSYSLSTNIQNNQERVKLENTTLEQKYIQVQSCKLQIPRGVKL